jgi:hypothetical protein
MAWNRSRFQKYGATRVKHRGYSFASKLEAAVFDILKLREKAGEIYDIKVQQRVYLLKDPDIYYISDFSFIHDDVLKYAEAKGMETPEWKIKKKLWQHFGPSDLEIWMGSYSRPKLIEIVKRK